MPLGLPRNDIKPELRLELPKERVVGGDDLSRRGGGAVSTNLFFRRRLKQKINRPANTRRAIAPPIAPPVIAAICLGDMLLSRRVDGSSLEVLFEMAEVLGNAPRFPIGLVSLADVTVESDFRDDCSLDVVIELRVESACDVSEDAWDTDTELEEVDDKVDDSEGDEIGTTMPWDVAATLDEDVETETVIESSNDVTDVSLSESDDLDGEVWTADAADVEDSLVAIDVVGVGWEAELMIGEAEEDIDDGESPTTTGDDNAVFDDIAG